MPKKRIVLLLRVFLLAGIVLGGGLTGPREASADCIDACNWEFQQCQSWCEPGDWTCLGWCWDERSRCYSSCPP